MFAVGCDASGPTRKKMRPAAPPPPPPPDPGDGEGDGEIPVPAAPLPPKPPPPPACPPDAAVVMGPVGSQLLPSTEGVPAPWPPPPPLQTSSPSTEAPND